MRYFWLACLTAGALSDMRNREVSLRLLAACASVGIAAAFREGIGGHLLGLAAGTAMLAINRITEGGIGTGDGLFFLASAGYLAPGEVWLLLLGGLAVSWVWSMAAVMGGIRSGKNVRKKTIPFLACVWPVGIWLTLA